MTTWVLFVILTATSGNGAAISNFEFYSKSECEKAAIVFNQMPDVKAVCIRNKEGD